MKPKLILSAIIMIVLCAQSVVMAETDTAFTEGIMGCSECIIAVASEAIQLSEEIISSDKESELQRLRDLGYPEDYDPNNPVAMGEVDPYAAMEPDMEDVQRSLMEEAMNDYYQPEPDISDRVLKP